MESNNHNNNNNNNYKTTLRIPTDAIKQLKHIAIDENKTLTQVIQEALDEYLANIEEREGEEI
ncbi:MAG TPA: ribbon-helix-helix protein, CopG family [Nitrososphaeraceae archaeon]|nr:ribbon-helix-helix protein, CopG family [Nitrososphaeraceae archaeon]